MSDDPSLTESRQERLDRLTPRRWVTAGVVLVGVLVSLFILSPDDAEGPATLDVAIPESSERNGDWDEQSDTTDSETELSTSTTAASSTTSSSTTTSTTMSLPTSTAEVLSNDAFGSASAWSDESCAWEHLTTDGEVLIASGGDQDCPLRAFDPMTGDVLWEAENTGAPPVIHGGVLYLDHETDQFWEMELVARRLDNGIELWRTRIRGILVTQCQPAVLDRGLVAMAVQWSDLSTRDESAVVVLDAASGELVWEDRTEHLIDLNTGEILGQVEHDRRIRSMALSDDAIHVLLQGQDGLPPRLVTSPLSMFGG